MNKINCIINLKDFNEFVAMLDEDHDGKSATTRANVFVDEFNLESLHNFRAKECEDEAPDNPLIILCSSRDAPGQATEHQQSNDFLIDSSWLSLKRFPPSLATFRARPQIKSQLC